MRFVYPAAYSNCEGMAMAEQKVQLVNLVNAFINGVHWGQVIRQENSSKKGDPILFGRGARSAQIVKELFEDFKKLVKIAPERIVPWTRGERDDEIDALVAKLNAAPVPSSERLPVNVMIAYMKRRLAGPEEFFVRAVANLVQLCLEMDHDGTYLQDLYTIYIVLGIKQLSLPDDDAGQIAAAEELSKLCAPGPYDSDARAFRPIIQKLVWWAEKNTGRRDRHVLAREMLEDAAIKPLIPMLKKLPPRRVAFLGHSMMMSLHWSTFGSWSDVAGETMKLLNPGFEYCGFQTGGLDGRGAVKLHLDNLLAWKPSETYILAANYGAEDDAAFEHVAKELKRIGSAFFIVDDNRPWLKLDPRIVAFNKRLCEKHGGTLLEYWALGQTAPGHENWACLDEIHMLTDGHLFYARETLKRWAAVSHR